MAAAAAAAGVVSVLLNLVIGSGAGPVLRGMIHPNFTASNILYIDNSGVFLESDSSLFKVSVRTPVQQVTGFYLCVVHFPTDTIVWAANRNSPVTMSGVVTLSSAALTVSDSNGTLVWSTPPLPSAISALRVSDEGNLLLLDSSNLTLWQSFDHPTHVLLSGQRFHAGARLASPISDSDLREGDYMMEISAAAAGDVTMLWKRSQPYWRLSADPRTSMAAAKGTVAYMSANATGLHLVTGHGSVVYAVQLPKAGFRIMKLDLSGRFRVQSFPAASATSSVGNDFVAPASDCDVPFGCGELGLCLPGGSNGSSCTCPLAFVASPTGGCSPAGGLALFSPSTCGTPATYVGLGAGIGYPQVRLGDPVASGEQESACQGRCDGNCSCLGFYYSNFTGSCFLFNDQLGSLVAGVPSRSYVKTVTVNSPADGTAGGSSSTDLVAILLPSVATFLIIVVLTIGGISWRRRRSEKNRKKRERAESSAADTKDPNHLGWRLPWEAIPADEDGDESDDEISIPGLPTRFTYAELVAATGDFRHRIGSGGFGDVYKGVLPDESEVAVKRISGGAAGSSQGRKEFCTEIAVIGSVHHVNLVRLRGFCVKGSRRMLVYEYMNRGSLDRSLFGTGGPVLEWGERMEVAVGAARGLSYLHSGCDHKIIHCDVKPENILLHDGGAVKISDFGLAKLMTSEQSSLFTTMRGTRGYLAPEWLTNAAISNKTDVYSYGMVLLEIVRGSKNRSAGDSTHSAGDSNASSAAGGGGGGGSYFPMVALEMHEMNRYVELADPRLEGRVKAAEVERAVKTALCCLHEEPPLRPTMTAVVGMLEGTSPVWEPRLESLGFLRLYGRGFTAGDFFPAATGNLSSPLTVASPSWSPSYMSAQQVSGPR